MRSSGIPRERIKAAPPLDPRITTSASPNNFGHSSLLIHRFQLLLSRGARSCASVPNRTGVPLNLAAAIATQKVAQIYPVYNTTASKFPRRITLQIPGLNKPKNDPNRGRHDRFWTTTQG